jgi:hypothetical protein
VKGLTVGRRSGVPATMLPYLVSAVVTPVPTIRNPNGHLAILTWFRSPGLHLPFAHDVGPTTKHVSLFLSSTAVYCLSMLAGRVNSPCSFVRSHDHSKIVLRGPAFQAVGPKAKERPCFAKWATNAGSCRITGQRPCRR